MVFVAKLAAEFKHNSLSFYFFCDRRMAVIFLPKPHLSEFYLYRYHYNIYLFLDLFYIICYYRDRKNIKFNILRYRQYEEDFKPCPPRRG